ncbi:MAG: glycogen synthase, partial [bacterium]
YTDFSPENDKKIPQAYNVENFRKEKVKNKLALQKELGLKQDEKVFMIGIVSRLTDQKGFDLIAYVLEEILSLDAIQMVVLGTGEERYENMFRYFDWKYNDKISANIYYSDELSHKIYAASDAFLMPSLFEPCGLSQLMSLKYGTLPIVRETGGLKDTVEPYNEYEGTGTGFTFANYNAHEMMHVIRYAEQVFYDDRKSWDKMVERAMNADFSWKVSAGKYQEMYDWLIGG